MMQDYNRQRNAHDKKMEGSESDKKMNDMAAVDVAMYASLRCDGSARPRPRVAFQKRRMYMHAATKTISGASRWRMASGAG